MLTPSFILCCESFQHGGNSEPGVHCSQTERWLLSSQACNLKVI